MGKMFATMILHASFPLTWYATWPYSEKVQFWSRSHPLRPNPGLRTKIPFDMFHIPDIYFTSVCIKILTTDWVIVKFKYLTFDPT